MKSLFGTSISRLCAAYGPALALMHYLTWTWGRIALGHWPRPSLDDPKDIPGLWMPYFLTTALGLLLPFAALIPLVRAGAAVAAVTRQPEKIRPVVEAVLATALLLASLLFLRWDPHHVTAWFAD
jgi:hypothetical protein